MSDLKLATTNYVDSHQSDGLEGEYTYENYHSIFKVGPDNTGLKLSGGASALTIDNYGTKSELSGNTLKLSTSEEFLGAESNITIAANFEQHQYYEPTATIALSNPLDISNSRIHFEFKNGDDTVWGINKNDGSLYVNGPVQFKNKIIDKNGQEITGGGSGGNYPHIHDDINNTIYISGPAKIGSIIFSSGYGTAIQAANPDASVYVNGPFAVEDDGERCLHVRKKEIHIGSKYALTTVFFKGPIYDQNGDEITGGGGGDVSDLIHTEAWDNNAYALIVGNDQNSTFITGPYIGIGDSNTEYGVHIPGDISNTNVYLGVTGSNTIFINGPTIIQTGGVRLDLDAAKLQKLKDLLS